MAWNGARAVFENFIASFQIYILLNAVRSLKARFTTSSKMLITVGLRSNDRNMLN